MQIERQDSGRTRTTSGGAGGYTVGMTRQVKCLEVGRVPALYGVESQARLPRERLWEGTGVTMHFRLQEG